MIRPTQSLLHQCYLFICLPLAVTFVIHGCFCFHFSRLRDTVASIVHIYQLVIIALADCC